MPRFSDDQLDASVLYFLKQHRGKSNPIGRWELVAKIFGISNMATLFGVVMLAHQMGGFLGAWLGGRIFEQTGSYQWIWYVDILLAAAAAMINLPIQEAAPARLAGPVTAKTSA